MDSNGFHTDYMGILCGFYKKESRWIPYGFCLDSIRILNGFHIWVLHRFYILHGFFMDCTKILYGCWMDSAWILYMDSTQILCGFGMDFMRTLWIMYDSEWIPHGFYIDS